MENPVPVSIITGYLGSGKTTLLNRLLQSPGLANALVIINEFGEVGIDHLLVSAPTENMRLLSNGCLCCEVRGDLVETLADAARQRREGKIQPFDRVIVETTGLADPVPLVQTVVTDRDVAPSYRLDSIITVIDAVNALSQFDRQPESVKQVAVADLLLLSKTDLVSEVEIVAVQKRVRMINPSVETVRVIRGEIEPQRLFGCGTVDASATAAQLKRWMGVSGDLCGDSGHIHDAYCGHLHDSPARNHHDHVQTFSITLDHPVTRDGLVVWLTMLASFRSADLLRVKGIVNVEGSPMVINAVQFVLHEPVELAAWPSPDRKSHIVFIVQDLKREDLERTLDALLVPETAQPGNPLELDPQAYAQFMQMAKTFI